MISYVSVNVSQFQSHFPHSHSDVWSSRWAAKGLLCVMAGVSKNGAQEDLSD